MFKPRQQVKILQGEAGVIEGRCSEPEHPCVYHEPGDTWWQVRIPGFDGRPRYLSLPERYIYPGKGH